MKIRGYPLVFNESSVDLGGFVEVVRPSAVDRALRFDADIVALHNHNSDHPLGRTSARTLTLTKDARGLAIDLDVDESIGYVADLIRVVKRGDAIGGSFGFRALDDLWSMRDGLPFRELLDIAITEISIGVAFPAYPKTQLSIRHDAGSLTAPRHTRSVAFMLREHKQRLTKDQLQRFTGDQLRLAK